MKIIRAIIRPEREEAILKNLEEAGIFAMTKFPVLGRGKQKGIQVGKVNYDLLAKVMLILVVEEEEYPKAVAAIENGGNTGHPGDGKIFAQEISEIYTIRTGERKIK
ncbi:MAG TPA: P-II family nitrogen regulator [Candidatus Manganitrophaceae bacterium]|nr:P-II family nitrogen regulator [Candidatus Manganitrophaceae bacterium]